jgi:hypothetical protein
MIGLIVKSCWVLRFIIYEKWKFKFPPSHSLYQIMLGTTSSNNHLTNEQVGSIPNFIRNVHHHYVKVPKKLPHVSILNFLNRITEQLVYIKYIYIYIYIYICFLFNDNFLMNKWIYFSICHFQGYVPKS